MEKICQCSTMQLDEDFKDFIEQNKNTLKLGLNKYRAANEYLRTKPAPSYFKDEYTSLFIEIHSKKNMDPLMNIIFLMM